MSDWILSKEITSAGFMSAPADLSQQLEAQREIAIREIHANRSRAASSNASDDESGNIAPSVGEMSPVSEEPSEEITDYPLFTSCFEALDLENRKEIRINTCEDNLRVVGAADFGLFLLPKLKGKVFPFYTRQSETSVCC